MNSNEAMTQYAKCADSEELKHAEQLIEEDPENLSLLEWVAFLHYTNGNYERSIELFKKLVKMDAKNEGHLYYLANSLYKVQKLTLARMYWKKVIMTNPEGKFAEKSRGLLSDMSPNEAAA